MSLLKKYEYFREVRLHFPTPQYCSVPKHCPTLHIIAWHNNDTGRISRDHFVYVPSQWETTLQCNVVSHWLGAYTKWSLIWITLQTFLRHPTFCPYGYFMMCLLCIFWRKLTLLYSAFQNPCTGFGFHFVVHRYQWNLPISFRHWGSHTISPVPVKPPRRVWVNIPPRFTDITKPKQSIPKQWLYFMGCTALVWPCCSGLVSIMPSGCYRLLHNPSHVAVVAQGVKAWGFGALGLVSSICLLFF